MRQKNYKWIFYLAFLAFVGAILYITFQDITPVSRHVEETVKINFEK